MSFLSNLDREYQKGREYPVTVWQALALMFVGLKLAGEIGWSWWLVLIPVYMIAASILLEAFFKTIIEEAKK